MNRRHLTHALLVATAGLALRLALFMDVGVNGDTGLYLYDAKQILWGRQLLVEFPSRSPVMEYLLASVLSLGYSPILSARVFMVAVGIVLGGLIYLFARQLHSHRAGLAAAALFYLTPFSAVWGLWVKTEQVAGIFLLSGLLVALYVIDRDRIPWWSLATVGALFGTAFLVRRVAIVHIGAFALFVAWYRYRQHGEWRSTLTAAVGVVAASVATLVVAYALLARFDPGVTLAIADHHALALFKSAGEGSLGWIELTEPRAVTAEDRTGLLATVCQKCGQNTVTVFVSTILVALPALLPLLVYLRSYLKPAGFVGEVVLPVAFIVSGLFGLLQLIGTPYWPRAVMVGAVVGAVGLLWYLDAVPFDDLWSPKMALPALILLGLTAGYLYRDRILYVTYFQDFYPYVVTLSGIGIVAFVESFADRRRVLAAASVLVAAALVVGAGTAYPYNPDAGEDNRKWFSVEMVQAHGADINERTEPGERILTAQPLYVIESDRRIVSDLSRRYYLFRGWPHTALAEHTEEEIVRDLESGRAAYVIVDSELEAVYNNTDRIQPTVNRRFQRAEGGELYGRTNAVLLERRANATE